jgi:hypothetical protein
MVESGAQSNTEAAGFRLLDDAQRDEEPRPTQYRSEIKFLLPYADIGKLRSILEVNCRRICYSGPVSLVNSIYFDDAGLSAYRESIEGNGRRAKVRLRWYGRKDTDSRFHFEVKSRAGIAVGKERLAIGSQIPLSRLSFHDILRELSRALPAKHRELLMSRPEPVLITEYKREYFQARHDSVRITLDYDVTWFDQSGKHRPGKKFGVRDPEMVIVEGKSPVGKEPQLPQLLFPLRPRVTRSSKYVMGCQRLGLVAGGAGDSY